MIDVNVNELNNMLNEGLVKVTFTKRDGTTRVMLCTLQESLLPAREEQAALPPETDLTGAQVMSVWDVEANGWRSFRIDSIISVEAA